MIYYIGHYTDIENVEHRASAPSATNKMNYVIEVLEKQSAKCVVISCSMTSDKRGYGRSRRKIGNNSVVEYFRTFGRKNFFSKVLDLCCGWFQLLYYLVKNVNQEDTLLVYHATNYCILIPLVKFIKKFSLLLEVEEVYSDVNNSRFLKMKENYIYKKADGYIFSAEVLAKKINTQNKPSIVLYGDYRIVEINEKNREDSRIHVVYAGTLDSRKGGALAAINSATFLGEEYHMHIIGFGTPEDTERVVEEVCRVSKTTKCGITFEGKKVGKEYIDFLQKCDIGLSTQNPEGTFNDTSFPSKILSYMSNGLRVISARIPAVESSVIGEYIYYYDEQTAEAIANTIISMSYEEQYSPISVVENLSKNFQHDIKRLLGEFCEI